MAEERRVVTILFADVAGSTALGDTLDPEDVRVLLRRYYDVARETVTEHGGILEKFIGDAVVAVFGFPHTHDDDPQRALAAALVLRDRVRADPMLGDRLPIRLGINTGEVVAVRESATGDFPLSGDAVNVAARLQQATEPWSILCGERTVASVRAGFEFGSVLSIDARGKSQPIRALPLLGRSARLPVANRTPLIGRDADLQQLELVARRALHEQRPFLVSIIAPAGVGKTRLLEEFLERLPGIEPTATVAIAQCLPYGQRLTYWPLRGVLYRLIGVSDDAKAHTVRSAIRVWLEGSGLEAMDREVELLAATVGAGETEVSDRSALLAAWRTLFEIAASRAPLVLVFEDLHWSSDSLLDLFEFVMQPRGDLPLLMIALTRPELLERRPSWGGGRRNYTSISLEPLSDRDTAELVERLLAGCSAELVDRVVRHAEGNPFFAGELVRSIAERPSANQLPDTVQATVLARLDLLAPEERRIIQLGSVFGRAFRPPGLLALEPTLQGLDEAIDGLVDKDLLRSTGADIFAFRHILIREVAYQTLTRSERGRLHASAAAWLEGLAVEREHALAELIAYHYREAALIETAQRPGEAETERVRKKAVDWLSRAAEVAAAAAASLEGSRHLRSAIDLAERARLPDLYQRLGEMAESGDLVVEAYRTALRLCREQGRSANQELQILAGLLTTYMRFQGSVTNRPPEEAMTELRRDARAVAAHVTDDRSLAAYLAAEGFIPFWLSGGTRAATAEEIAAADASARKALEIARGLDDPKLQSVALDALSGTAQDQNDWRRSREYARQRLAFQERLGVEEKIDAHSMAAWSSALLGDLDDAERVSAQGLAQVQPGQFPSWTLHLVAWRIYTLTLLGRWDEALTMAERARQLWIECGRAAAGYSTFGFMSAMDIARARQDHGLLELYGGITDEILAAFPTGTPFSYWLGYGSADLAFVEDAVQRFHLLPDVQLQRFERGLSLLLDHDRLPPLEAIVPMLESSRAHEFLVVEAQTERAMGRAQRDVDRLGRSISLLERAGALPYAARVHCERALITHDHGEMEAGLAVLARLGDTEQLARFERLQVG
ncbi:MAG TPA: adenylate/guanylate cyclase domain-containing protein [Candidatus Dormibacteraeota bacterium]|nr:adenylate/guanylate cyclase domain-containing protein [Candidatus Dormibacteraeota bacterium]